MSPSSPAPLCLEIFADADPVLLIQLVERIQSLGMIPKQLTATWMPDDCCSILLAFVGLDPPRVELLARRIEQFTTVRSVAWHKGSAVSDEIASR